MTSDRVRGRIVIITGLSGSGKSTALTALEDNGFFCIDNLPVLLLPKFLALRDHSNPEIMKIGLVMDMREPEFVSSFKEVFDQINSHDYDLKIIFLEASDKALVKRYSETRRRHPLATEGGLVAGIQQERSMMAPVREAATDIIDTSGYNLHKLREIITSRFALTRPGGHLSLELLSFGFKYGSPTEAAIVMDVRFLPNPFYLDDLRELDGRDQPVIEYVMSSEEAGRFVDDFVGLLEFMIPLFQREGKSYLTIAVGCTGGQHRSVAIVGRIAEKLRGNHKVSVRHRELSEQCEGA